MRPRRRVHGSLAFFVGLLAVVLALPTIALAADPAPGPAGVTAAQPRPAQRDTLLRYARDTWASFDAMTDAETGLPADSLAFDGAASVHFAGCREGKDPPPPSAYTNGVVTPHASFLALRWAPNTALDNLARLERAFPSISGDWGFRDSVNVQTGRVSDAYLSLDQGIVMAAIGNALGKDMLRRAFATKEFRLALQPLISMEEFSAGPRSRAAQVDRP